MLIGIRPRSGWLCADWTMKIKLNLVPPERKAELEKIFQLRRVFKWETELLAIFVLLILALVSINAIVKINLSIAKNNLDMIDKNSEQYQVIGDYDKEIKNVSTVVSDIGTVQNAQLYWSKFLTRLDEKVITGIAVSKLETDNFDISLAGRADMRDNLIAFKENIEKDACFSDVNFPLSNLVSKGNIEFQINFKIKKECLKP